MGESWHWQQSESPVDTDRPPNLRRSERGRECLIYKKVLAITDVQVISLPERSTILSVADQRGSLCLWYQFLVEDQLQKPVGRVIEIVGTGNPMPECDRSTTRRFIGTVVMEPFVWHVFERGQL